MRANRRRDTKPELELRRALWVLGYRYRTDLRVRAGSRHPRPDIVFTKRRVAVFLDGCFWHGCPDHCRMPKRNSEFWDQKIYGNRVRDRLDTIALEQSGWTVVRLWEHVPVAEAVARVVEAIAAKSKEEQK